jgi:aspartyl-tRNA(Asn)/glutamyl-tRNA(Gln) amidotransferase subunit C
MTNEKMTNEKITHNEVLRVGHMSRLRLDETEAHRLKSELNDILGYISRLDQLDTESVPPMSHVQTTTNVLREDTVERLLTVEEALRNTPETKGTYIKVPLVIEG